MWRKPKGASPGPLVKQKSDVNLVPASPLPVRPGQGRDLERTMMLSLKDLADSPQKDTVMVVWGELAKVSSVGGAALWRAC